MGGELQKEKTKKMKIYMFLLFCFLSFPTQSHACLCWPPETEEDIQTRIDEIDHIGVIDVLSLEKNEGPRRYFEVKTLETIKGRIPKKFVLIETSVGCGSALKIDEVFIRSISIDESGNYYDSTGCDDTMLEKTYNLEKYKNPIFLGPALIKNIILILSISIGLAFISYIVIKRRKRN